MVAHYVRDVGVGRSSRLIPTFMRSIFYLQRNDRNAIIVILMIIAIICSLIIFIGGEDDGSRQGVADSTLTQHPERIDKEHPLYYKVDEEIHEVFAFDPNTADSTDLLRLGLQEWQVRSIYRYRAKGGIYRRPEDFARLYGLTKKQYETLRPYIIIGEDYGSPDISRGKVFLFYRKFIPLHHEQSRTISISAVDSAIRDTFKF